MYDQMAILKLRIKMVDEMKAQDVFTQLKMCGRDIGQIRY